MAVKTSSPTIKPLIPPDESMWQKYSPHYELPLASATSIFLHGLILGILAVGGIAYFFTFNEEATRPPSMDVVMLDGGGTGLEGLGGEQGLPGAADAGKTEITPSANGNPPEASEAQPSAPQSKDPPPELDLPQIDDGFPPVSSDLQIQLAKIAADAESQVRAAMDLPKTPPARPKKVASGTGNPKGTGGLGGSGGGTGLGNKKGPGQGAGGMGGRQATDQEAKDWRSRIDLYRDAK